MSDAPVRYLQFDALTASGLLDGFQGRIEPVTRVSEMDDISAFAAGRLQVDVMAVFGPYVEHYTHPLGILEPLDLSRLSNWSDVQPAWRNAPPFCVDGVHIAVPNNWGTDSLIVRDGGAGDPAGDSLAMLFEPEPGTRIAMPGQDGIETVAVAGMYLGVEHPFSPSDEELEAIAELLRRQRAHVVRYWETERELVAAFAAGEVDLAWGWLPTCVELRRQQVPVRWGRPREGEILWADGNGIATGTESVDEAYRFLDFLLSPEYLYALYRKTGYRTCSTTVTAMLTDAERAELELDDPDRLVARCVAWVSPPPALQRKIEDVWREAVGASRSATA